MKTKEHGPVRPMYPRDPLEGHRNATPLELLFDLVTVIAVAAAAGALHHAVAEGHAVEGAARYLMTFFAIWWAWMNFTWFASAYDNDDAIYRLLTMVIMAGSLVMASGVEQFSESLDISVVVAGYVIMRVGMIAMWTRASRHDPARKTTTLRYAAGIALAQLYWVGVLLLASQDSPLFFGLVLFGFLLELAVPAIAERANPTPWHRHHIIERYGLLTIIVLGEVLLAGVVALQSAFTGAFDIRLFHIAISALVITFAMWLMYFSEDEHLQSQQLYHVLLWGYGHIVVFAAGAAVGAGFAVLVDIVAGNSALPLRNGDLAVAIPLAAYMLGLWFVRDRFVAKGARRWVLPTFAMMIAAIPIAFPALELIAALAAASVMVRAVMAHRFRQAR